MESLLAVEKEVDKALDSFDTFYEGVYDDIEKVLETVLKNMNEIMKSKCIYLSNSFFHFKLNFIFVLS
jgi:hypothetical protein